MKPSVYIVDNEESILDALSARLRAEGFESIGVRSGPDLLTLTLPQQRACLVLDIRLPRMDGLELIRALRARGVQLPVIVISAYGEASSVVRALREGAVDFFEKPFEIDKLIQRIRELTVESPVQGVLTRMTRRLTPDEAANLFREIMPRMILEILAEVDQSATVESITRMAEHFARPDVMVRIRAHAHVRDGILTELVTCFQAAGVKVPVDRSSVLSAVERSGALHRLRVLEACLVHAGAA
jgi:FixJ family two-component response regulator